MRSLVVFGTAGSSPYAPSAFGRVQIDRIDVPAAIINGRRPLFEPEHPASRSSVLVRVHAFSCNYRDRTFIHTMGAVPSPRFFALGSEFSGEIVAVGADVSGLAPGDRVVTNHHYTNHAAPAHQREGVATNHASREYQVLPARSVVAIPVAMDDVTGAAFSLSAQTAYSMVRKVSPHAGMRALVMSASSNTSLFLVSALRARGVQVHAATSSSRADERLHSLGVSDIVHLPTGDGRASGRDVLRAFAREHGAFNAVLDPFCDLHLGCAPDLLADFGVYVTCGFAAQNAGSARTAIPIAPADVNMLMYSCIVKNLSIVGNCIGLTQDLRDAIADYSAERLPVVIDSVYRKDDAVPFLRRTFADPDRFGKVVFRYEA